MNALIQGLLGLAVCAVTSLASAQPADNVVIEAAPSPAPVVATRAPTVSRTVSLAPQDREFLPEEEPRWYGWQNLAVDGGALAFSVAAAGVDSSDSPGGSENLTQALLLGAVVGYGAGGPAIHLVHGHPWKALGSLGLRGGLPVLGGAIGLASATCPPPDGGDYGNCGLGELIMGAAAGVVIALVIDDGFLTWEKPARDEVSQARLGVTPVVSSDGRRELRVFGTF
jgi:hypothetical protein